MQHPVEPRLGPSAMAFDECIENPAPYDYVKPAPSTAPYRWLVRCKAEIARLNALPDTVNPQQMLLGINQGGTYDDLRIRHMQQIAELDLHGLRHRRPGRRREQRRRCTTSSTPSSPICRRTSRAISWGSAHRSNIIEGGRPRRRLLRLRHAQRAMRATRKLFTWEGAINLNNAKYELRHASPSTRPVTARSAAATPARICAICSRQKRCWPCGLAVMHNLYFYNTLMERIRQALDEGRFEEFRRTYSERLDRRI